MRIVAQISIWVDTIPTMNNSLAADSPVWLSQLELALYQGLAADDLKLEEHPGFRYRPQKRMQVNYTAPGDVFKVDPIHLQ